VEERWWEGCVGAGAAVGSCWARGSECGLVLGRAGGVGGGIGVGVVVTTEVWLAEGCD
jgi:hypothetical protein